MKDPVTPEQQALFSRGTDIGIYSRKLFPGGIDASPSSPLRYSESVAKTKELINSGKDIIYEAAFIHNGVLVAVDMLVRKNGRWYAYEVKSSVRISATYLIDVSLQYYVITGAGIELEDVFIVHLNNEYKRHGQVEVDKLFKMVSVKNEVIENSSFIDTHVSEQLQMIAKKEMPDVPISERCFSPYKCSYWGYCWKNIPDNSIFELSGISKEEQFSIFKNGTVLIKDMNTSGMKEEIVIQVEGMKTGEPFIKKQQLREFLSEVIYPVSFLDFESFMPAIPLYDETGVYEHIPFQYSLHIRNEPQAQLEHKEFLAIEGIDPREEFIQRLIADLPKEGSVVVYNSAFERSILNKMKHLFPQHSHIIDGILNRMLDLMLPFQKKLFYHPAMRGSFSIKSVLPALVQGYDYSLLGIGSGALALCTYEDLQKEQDIFKREEKRNALLEYCKMDTLAMVKILEVLEESVK